MGDREDIFILEGEQHEGSETITHVLTNEGSAAAGNMCARWGNRDKDTVLITPDDATPVVNLKACGDPTPVAVVNFEDRPPTVTVIGKTPELLRKHNETIAENLQR